MAYDFNSGSYSKFKFSKKGKKRGIIAGLISFAVLQSTLGAVLGWIPIIGGIVKLLGLGASALIGLVVAVMNTDLDVATPRQQRKLERQLETIPQSSNPVANETITKGQEMVRQIREANNAIPDPEITRQLYEVENLCIQIFRTVSEDPDKAPQIRKFMNYYLPTTVKMLQNYRTMMDRGVSSSQLSEARDALCRGLNMILSACQKQLDSLFQNNVMDVNTDIDVLEQMLKRDGFAQGSTENAPMIDATQRVYVPSQNVPNQNFSNQNARTAAAAQLGSQAHPTLNLDLDQMDIYPHTSTKKQRSAE